MNRLTFLALPVALLALALAACGGDDGGEDEDQIAEVIETVTTDPDANSCTELRTQEFVEQTEFETGEEAVQSCREDIAEQNQADSVEVSNVEVEGDSATAEVAVTGGGLDGQTVELALVKEDDQWKLDQLVSFIELDRASLDAAFTEEIQGSGDVVPQTRQCIADEFTALSDQQVEDLFVSGDQSQFEELFAPCIEIEAQARGAG
jgi:hypothetical protein